MKTPQDTTPKVTLTTAERWRVHAAVELTMLDPVGKPPSGYIEVVESIIAGCIAKALWQLIADQSEDVELGDMGDSAPMVLTEGIASLAAEYAAQAAE